MIATEPVVHDGGFGFFLFLRSLVETEDGLILFLFGLILLLEILDFLSGSIAAIINPDIKYTSKVGINGLLRKITGVLLLAVLIPMSILLPEQAGTAFLYTIYLGYILLTFKSLVENYGKAKGDTSVFENVIKTFERLAGKENKDKDGGDDA